MTDHRRPRGVRWNDEEWAAVKAAAGAEGVGVSALVRARSLTDVGKLRALGTHPRRGLVGYLADRAGFDSVDAAEAEFVALRGDFAEGVLVARESGRHE